MNAPLRHRRPDDRALASRAWWELRHGRLRLALAENELQWAQVALAAGDLKPSATLQILDDVFDELAGASS